MNVSSSTHGKVKRADTIYTPAQSLVVNRFGSVSTKMLRRIHTTRTRAFGILPR